MSDSNDENEHEPLDNGDESDGDDEELVDDEIEFPPARRGPRPVHVIGTIVLILIIIAGGLAAARTIGKGVIGPAPTPTPTLFPGENLFYVTTYPSWGTISIDGHKMTHLPKVGDTPIELSEGGHEIVWNAPPFPAQRCLIYVPPQANSGSGTCSANDSAPVRSGKYSGLQATVISFTASASMLSQAQLTSLEQATQATLNSLQSTDTVQPGEQYVDLSAPHMLATASQPLKATLHFQLDTNPNTTAPCVAVGFFGPGQSCQAMGGNCHVFCDGQGSFGWLPTSIGPSWSIYAMVGISWDYTTPGGQVVAKDQPDVADSTNPEFLVPFYVTWDGTNWHVSDQPGQSGPYAFYTANPSCLPMEAVVQGNGVEPSYFGITTNELTTVTVNGQPQPLFWGDYVSGTNAAAGCLGGAAIQPSNPATPVTSSMPTAYCLYRFGVLIAANALAHQYWPNLPVVDAYEQGIAQQLMQQVRA